MYRVVVQDQVKPTVGALPADGLLAWFQVLDALKDNPNANILTLYFGPDAEGMAAYMVVERDREVHVVEVTWVG